MLQRLPFLLVGFLLCCVAAADEITGRVVGIADGDTLTILDSSRTQHKIRINGIDAPEKKQPYGNASKQHLSDLAYGKEARAACYKQDRYGREVCTVFVDDKDIGLAQLDAGPAWWYRKYAHEQLPRERTEYESAEGRRPGPPRSPGHGVTLDVDLNTATTRSTLWPAASRDA